MIGISNYEGLINRNFNLPEDIRKCGGMGFTGYRVFTDLGWGLNGKLYAKDNIYLYEYDKIARRFDQKKINTEFVTKLYEAGKAAKQSGMEGLTLCLATRPLYYKDSPLKSFPWQLGYRDIHAGFVKEPKEGFIQVVDTSRAEWKAFEKYMADLADVMKNAPNPFMFQWVETCNELKRWGSVGDSHPRMSIVMKKRKSNIKFQMNPPLEELHDGYDERYKASHNHNEAMKGAFEWPLRLRNGFKEFKAGRFSFHGFFTGKEIEKEAYFLKEGGLRLNEVVFETDGATPNTIFTREAHARHYDWRLKWTESEENTNMTIDAHTELIAAAKKVGVNLIIQSPIKWSLMQPTEQLNRFYEACGKALQQ